MLNGAVPVRLALIVADPPAHIGALPLTVAVGCGSTSTVIVPEDVPLQKASLIVLMLYVVVPAGLTTREATVPEPTVWLKPSDQRMLNGAVPVRLALIVAEPPAHIDVAPLSEAAGVGLMATFALPLFAQPLSVTVTFRTVVPDAPALNVIAFVVAPPVIVPFTIDHAYVAPAIAATLALLPVEFGHVDDGALMVAEGGVQFAALIDAENSEVPSDGVPQLVSL